MDIKKILWPTDLSENSKRAAAHVVSLAEKHGAEIVLFYVGVDMCKYFPAYGNYPSSDQLREFQDWDLEHAKEKMKNICENYLSSCPSISVKLAQGDAAEEILKAVDRENADLIVLSTRGHGGVKEETAYLGSVAEEVVKNATVPVYTVQPEKS